MRKLIFFFFVLFTSLSALSATDPNDPRFIPNGMWKYYNPMDAEAKKPIFIFSLTSADFLTLSADENKMIWFLNLKYKGENYTVRDIKQINFTLVSGAPLPVPISKKQYTPSELGSLFVLSKSISFRLSDDSTTETYDLHTGSGEPIMTMFLNKPYYLVGVTK